MRTHIVQSWVGACEYDEGDTYNGQQIGNRNQKSIGVLIERSGDQWKAGNVDQQIPTFINGRANVAAFAEPVTKSKTPAKKKVDAFSSIMLADRNYTRLSNLSEALDAQFDNGELSLEDWAAARKNIDKRLAAGWLRVCKERSWCPEGKDIDNHPEHDLTFNLEDIEESSFRWEKQRVKRELTGWSTIDNLSEDNSFRGLFCKVKKIMMFVQKVNAVIKESF